MALNGIIHCGRSCYCGLPATTRYYKLKKRYSFEVARRVSDEFHYNLTTNTACHAAHAAPSRRAVFFCSGATQKSCTAVQKIFAVGTALRHAMPARGGRVVVALSFSFHWYSVFLRYDTKKTLIEGGYHHLPDERYTYMAIVHSFAFILLRTALKSYGASGIAMAPSHKQCVALSLLPSSPGHDNSLHKARASRSIVDKMKCGSDATKQSLKRIKKSRTGGLLAVRLTGNLTACRRMCTPFLKRELRIRARQLRNSGRKIMAHGITVTDFDLCSLCAALRGSDFYFMLSDWQSNHLRQRCDSN